MEDRYRLILAVVLTAAVFLVWSVFFSPPKYAPQSPAETTNPANPPAAAPAPGPAGNPDFTMTKPQAVSAAVGREVAVETPLYRAVFNTQGGVLVRFELKKHLRSMAKNAGPMELVGAKAADLGPLGLIWNGQATWRQGAWDAAAKDLSLLVDKAGTLTFTGEFGGLQFKRTLRFSADTYLISEETQLLNTTPAQANGRLTYTLASSSLEDPSNSYNPTRVSFFDAKGFDEQGDKDKLAKEGLARDKDVLWGAVQDNYFLAAIAPESGEVGLKAKMEDGAYRVALEKAGLDLAPGVERTVRCAWYLGPRMAEYLDAAPNQLAKIITYGWTDLLAKPLLVLMNWLFAFSHNYGVAIILLTIIIKAVLWPLSQKSYQSMNQMKKIQPLMARIREQYKDDRAKMSEEMMRLYKTYKVSPMGGCLPMFVQLPVFIGLYQALLGAIELRHAAFISHLPFTDMVWLADLSAKDPYYITPLVMGASMFLQQKLTPAPGDPTQAKVMMFMPVIFTFMFLNFPSGLVVYWLVNNILSIAQQWWMMRAKS